MKWVQSVNQENESFQTNFQKEINQVKEAIKTKQRLDVALLTKPLTQEEWNEWDSSMKILRENQTTAIRINSYKMDEPDELENFLALIYDIHQEGEKDPKSLKRFTEKEGFSEFDQGMELNFEIFSQKMISSLMAIFLSEEKEFYDIWVNKYFPRRDKKDQSSQVKKSKDDKKKEQLAMKGELRKLFPTP